MFGMRSWRMTTFTSLALDPSLLSALDALEYTEMTPVQALSLPPILEKRDVIAQAPTGSGKTAAFGLGLIARLDPAQSSVQGIVLCPTRELADHQLCAIHEHLACPLQKDRTNVPFLDGCPDHSEPVRMKPFVPKYMMQEQERGFGIRDR